MKTIRLAFVVLVVLGLTLPGTLQTIQASPLPDCCGEKSAGPCAQGKLAESLPACCKTTPAAPPEPAQPLQLRSSSTVAHLSGAPLAHSFSHPPLAFTRPERRLTSPADMGALPLFKLHAAFLI